MQKTFHHNSTNIFYRVDGEGIAVVLVHGFGEDGNVWNEQTVLKEYCKLIIPDLPGSGKSTLMKLLVGLYRPQEGKILYNNLDETEIHFDDLRNQIGFVTQDTQLFSGTIRENLMFVNPKATEEELLDALDKASCNYLLSRAEKGVDTMIGEGGLKLSGGEKQRLSIARALIRKPKLLIFDEATSSLDSLTEEEITDTIRTISSANDQITILIAHRLSTIMHADRIYVLEKGEVVETGAHADLLSEKGLYYAMWRQQIGERKSMQTI